MTDRFHVPGVSCQHCVNAVTAEVSVLPGVQRVQVDLGSKTVMVEHGDQTRSEQIIAAINEAGYEDVTPLNAS